MDPGRPRVYAGGIRHQFLAKLSPEEVATLKAAMGRIAAIDE